MCKNCKPVETVGTVEPIEQGIVPFEYHTDRKEYTSDKPKLESGHRYFVERLWNIFHDNAVISCQINNDCFEVSAPLYDKDAIYAALVKHYDDRYSSNIARQTVHRFAQYQQMFNQLGLTWDIKEEDHSEKTEKNRQKRLKQIIRHWQDCFSAFVYDSRKMNALPDSSEVDWRFRDDKGMPLHKRLAKISYDCGVKLSSQQIETLGNLIGEQRIAARQTAILAFDDDYMDGTASEYGHGRSCWFQDGDYKGSRQALYNAGGFAVRTFNATGEFTGGRCWIVPCAGGRHAIFNAYGRTLSQFAELLSSMWKCHYKEAATSRVPDGFYVNKNECIVLSPDAYDLNRMSFDHIEVDDEDRYICHCGNCGEGLTDRDSIYSGTGGDGHYCESCYSELFSSCQHCGETYDTGDLLECIGRSRYGSENLCEHCAESLGYSCCTDCEEWKHDCSTTHDGESVCSDCIYNYTTCEGCSELFPSADCEQCEADECYYCSDCMPGEQYCQATGEVIDTDDIGTDWHTERNSRVLNSHCPILATYGDGTLPVRAECISDLSDRINRGDDVSRFPVLAATALDLCLAGF